MSGCGRILARLEHGPASAAELYATTYTVVHSRIADLRRRGYRIDCERDPEQAGAAAYVYTLKASPPLTAAAGPAPPPSNPGSAQLMLDWRDREEALA